MRDEIHKHKFIEFGKHQNHYYGIKVESVLDVINSGKMCILDVHPQVHWRERERERERERAALHIVCSIEPSCVVCLNVHTAVQELIYNCQFA